MKIGYMPDTHGGPYNQPEPTPEASAKFCDQLLNEGIVAEQAGFDGVFLPERHHRTETMFPPPLIMLAGYATRTTRVDLGTFVLQSPYYNPMHLAEDVAMIDLMSKPVTSPYPSCTLMNPPTRAPTIPIMMVTMKPPGSRPGMMNLAIMPATKPKTIQISQPMSFPLQRRTAGV